MPEGLSPGNRHSEAVRGTAPATWPSQKHRHPLLPGWSKLLEAWKTHTIVVLTKTTRAERPQKTPEEFGSKCWLYTGRIFGDLILLDISWYDRTIPTTLGESNWFILASMIWSVLSNDFTGIYVYMCGYIYIYPYNSIYIIYIYPYIYDIWLNQNGSSSTSRFEQALTVNPNIRWLFMIWGGFLK